MRDITLVLPHYKNLGMLEEQQRIWMDYPEELRARLHVIVVDDGSPKGFRPSKKSIMAPGLGSFRLYRILKDVRWNWLACRNLGVREAATEWVFLTDIDHAIPAETFERLTTMPLETDCVYRLARVDAPHPWPFTIAECPVREAKRYHPNTWFLTRKMFDSTGGYDERLSGCYGTDGEFRDRIREQARAVVQLSDVTIRYAREVLADASTVGLTRKNDPMNDADLLRRRQARSVIAGWKPLRNTFPWEQLA